MKKRILSLTLALTMVLAMSISVFAGSYSSDGYYEGSYYEIVDTCYSNRYSSSTFCSDYAVYSNVLVTDDDNQTYFAPGSSAFGASTTSGQPGYQISHIKCTHHVNGNVVRTITVYA